jgi:NAD(P)-dependent dehydrogenase (short-subunit alcohol dehydrogenase family)
LESEKKVALITGGNRGIGFETARQLGREGIVVVVASRLLGAAEDAITQLRNEGIDAYPVKLDVRSAEDRSAAVRTISGQFGKLDILINNAGLPSKDGMFVAKTVETSEEELESLFGTNVFAVVAVTRAFLPLLKKSSAGRIVSISSLLGSLTLHADPNSRIARFKTFAYGASKSALNAFTIHLAAELKDTNIKVNSAHPGWVKTRMGTRHAPMSVEDGAKTGVELALIGPEGPSGRFIHLGCEIPW